MIDLKDNIRTVPDFPEKGVLFYDITTLLGNAEAFHQTVAEMKAYAEKCKPDVIVALESRGFLFGSALAYELGLPFVPVRKKGKLPFNTYSETYLLEYGSASIEVHTDAMEENKRVLIVDDVLATGGTASAAINLVSHFKPKSINLIFLMELENLQGRNKIENYPVESIIKL